MVESSSSSRLQPPRDHRWPLRRGRLRHPLRPVTLMLLLTSVGLGLGTRARAAENLNVTVLVKDAESGKPINQARLTLQFHEPGKIRHKLIAYSAKTNAQGRYRFTLIPKGTVRLIVTSEQHQTFSKEFELDENNQVLEVKLKTPQPLL